MLVESLTSDWREVLLHTPFSVTPPPSPFQSENPGIVIMSLVRTHTHTQQPIQFLWLPNRMRWALRQLMCSSHLISLFNRQGLFTESALFHIFMVYFFFISPSSESFVCYLTPPLPIQTKLVRFWYSLSLFLYISLLFKRKKGK